MILQRYLLTGLFVAVILFIGGGVGSCFAAHTLSLPPPCHGSCKSSSGQNSLLQYAIPTTINYDKIQLLAAIPGPIIWKCRFACPLP
ncbi:Uncharacterised protein [Yersinia thracica]|uniref:Lipoprotein n=1 Tax=Yersinia thracica TaxID=2890319 RepID=A0A0T9P0B5_9GAMM|nr:Uncharacterised protein [Yersinia thracica]